ncbi:MAG: response regulator [Halieaceae bacterium]
MKILLVDDEPLLLIETAEMLEGFGHSVTSAGSAEQALTELSVSDDYEVLLSDMRMPGMSGLDLIRYARIHFFADRESMRFILMSGHLDMKDTAERLYAEKISFIPKPISAKQLLNEIEQ